MMEMLYHQCHINFLVKDTYDFVYPWLFSRAESRASAGSHILFATYVHKQTLNSCISKLLLVVAQDLVKSTFINSACLSRITTTCASTGIAKQ